MTDIKVILESGQVDIHSLSQEERDVLFDQLSLEHEDIPKSTFDNFSNMVTESIRQEFMANKPELKELLLRRIIVMGTRGELNTLVIPIIQSMTVGRDVHGGATIRKFKPLRVEAVTSPDAINVRFDTRILAVTVDGLEYIAPPNEELGIIGIVVNPRCKAAKTSHSGSLVNLKSTTISTFNIADRLLIGNYEYSDVARACDGYFKTLEDKTQSRIYMFKNGLECMNALFSYLSIWQAFITSKSAAQYIHAQLEHIDKSMRSGKLAKLFSFAQNLKLPTELPTPDKTQLMTLLESIANISFDTRYNSWVADIYGRGFAIAYMRSVLKGIDDPSTQEQIDIYKVRKERSNFQLRIRMTLLNEKNTLSIYNVIIEKKLGADRANQIEKKAPQTIAALLALLKPAEVKIVEMEYTRRDKYIAAWMNNKCAHVRVYRSFRNSFSNEQTKAKFNELSKFFKPVKSDMIICNVCGFDIICPHIKELTELELAGKNYGDIKAKLTKYIDTAHVKDQYYCKICGELISSLEAFGDVSMVMTTHMDEELKNFIWSEVAIMMKYMKFASIINVPSLITSTRDVIYPFIFEIEKQILKSKTNTVDEIKAKKRLFITVYAFAYLLRIVTKHRNIEFKGFKGAKAKNPLVDMIKYVIELISISRNIIIREIPGMTIDIIKNKLIEAYKSLQESTTTVIIHGQTEDLVNTLILDPVYKYLYWITIIDEILHGKLPKRGRMDMVDRIDNIMGESISKLEKSDDVFKYVNVPKFTNLNTSLKKLVGAVRSLDKYNEGLRGYVVHSFELFMLKLRRRLYTEPMYIDVSSDRTTMMIDARFRPPHEKYMIEYVKVLEYENILMKYKGMYYAKNFTTFSKGVTRQYVPQPSHLGRVYDENGITHSFGIYIYLEGDKIIEVKTSDIARATESGKQFTHTIIDKKCLICGVKWSEVGRLNETKIRLALDIKYTLGNFYRFYENRCPKGGLHDYAVATEGISTAVCKKCGFTNTGINVEFYNKYADVYAKERDEFAVEGVAVTYVTKPPDDLSRYANDYATWTPNFNIILELSNLIKINHRLINALGAVEKIEYANVLNGNYIPPEAENRNDTRIYVLVTHIKNLFTEWNQIRFFYRLVKPPTDLSILIDSSGINKHKVGELGKKLPDIYDEFNARFAYVQRNKKPREIVMFCIETFCLLCLKIWNDLIPETEKLRRNFVDYFVKKVLRGDEMLTKPGYFSWSLLYGDKDIKAKESFDSNYTESSERIQTDENEDTENIENFGETNEPLTLDAIDVEVDPDAEPDDDPGNEIRVEGYGLD